MANPPSRHPGNLLDANASPLKTILALFLFLRLTVLFLYTPQGLLNAFSDYYHYFRTVKLSELGYYPFVNLWYEYPPILAYLPQAAFSITKTVMPVGDVASFGYQVFARLLGIVLLVFDAGVLVLLYRIAERAWDREKATWLAWVYCTLSLPLFFWSYSHQVVAVFFSLLAIYWFTVDKPVRSAVALGLGIASKITPVFLFAPVARFLWPRWRSILIYGAVAVTTAASIYLPFVLLGGWPWIVASFAALVKIGSYGTVWAMLDGNWGPGRYGVFLDRLELAKAYLPHGNPSLVPGWIVLALFVFIYGLLFIRPLQSGNHRQFIWFSTLTAMLFHLWSKGWSPQWMVMILPLVLLSFPDRRGLAWALGLSVLTFVEWPLADLLAFQPLTALIILLRTGAFISLAVFLARQLWSSPLPLSATRPPSLP